MTFGDTLLATLIGALVGAVVGSLSTWLFALDLRRRETADSDRTRLDGAVAEVVRLLGEVGGALGSIHVRARARKHRCTGTAAPPRMPTAFVCDLGGRRGSRCDEGPLLAVYKLVTREDDRMANREAIDYEHAAHLLVQSRQAEPLWRQTPKGRDSIVELGKPEKAALDKVLAGRDLIKLFTPQRRVTALLDELRRNPTTRAILDGDAPTRDGSVDDEMRDHPREPSKPRQTQPLSKKQETNVLAMVVDYANGMTQQEIARRYGLHIQTARKRLGAAGVVMRARIGALTESDLDEARNLLAAGMSAREIGRGLGVAHTTLLRAIRRSDASLFEKSTNAHHETPEL